MKYADSSDTSEARHPLSPWAEWTAVEPEAG